MRKYCVNKHGDHEVHRMVECSFIPFEPNRVEFHADTDSEAMKKARLYYSDADGCRHCMPLHHRK